MNYDSTAIVQFQRAADAYAFQHRQVERRGAAPAALTEGGFFTPQAAAAFRDRLRSASCARPQAVEDNFVVPRVNSAIEGTSPLSPCLAAALRNCRRSWTVPRRGSGVDTGRCAPARRGRRASRCVELGGPAGLDDLDGDRITDTNTMPMATSEKLSLMIGTLPKR